MSSEASDLLAGIDRIAPTRRPAGRTAMRQHWADLLFLHWSVPPDALRPLLPRGLTLDTFEGRAYVGLVLFTMRGVRPIWSPSVPWLSAFHETNVRTYVHVEGRHPGVWFFSLDAANPVAVRLARSLWRLPYHFARMALTHEEKNGKRVMEYASERLWPGPLPATSAVSCRVDENTEPPGAARPGTLEHFLAERYLLYAGTSNRLFRGQVHHTPYPLQRATVTHLDESLVRAAGIERPDDAPLAHYARGVEVAVFPLRPVRPLRPVHR